jgi:hypothetical protein
MARVFKFGNRDADARSDSLASARGPRPRGPPVASAAQLASSERRRPTHASAVGGAAAAVGQAPAALGGCPQLAAEIDDPADAHHCHCRSGRPLLRWVRAQTPGPRDMPLRQGGGPCRVTWRLSQRQPLPAHHPGARSEGHEELDSQQTPQWTRIQDSAE